MANTKRQLNQECVSLFRSGVERVLTNWTALKLAVEHGAGGPKSRELAANFVQYIGDIFCEEGNIETEDVSDILVEVMDSQFDTWCEDNSPNEIASVLCRLYHFCLQESTVELKKEIDKLPVSTAKESKEWHTDQAQCQVDEVKMVASVPSLAPVTELVHGDQEMEEATRTLEEDPGWTQVKSRKKRVP